MLSLWLIYWTPRSRHFFWKLWHAVRNLPENVSIQDPPSSLEVQRSEKSYWKKSKPLREPTMRARWANNVWTNNLKLKPFRISSTSWWSHMSFRSTYYARITLKSVMQGGKTQKHMKKTYWLAKRCTLNSLIRLLAFLAEQNVLRNWSKNCREKHRQWKLLLLLHHEHVKVCYFNAGHTDNLSLLIMS